MIRAERHIETEKEVCGEITVFLSLILTCICALMGGLFESARAAEAAGICRWRSIPHWIR